MESSGNPNQIQISSATAQLLMEFGKQDWIRQRDDTVNVKGKGVLASYWLEIDGPNNNSSRGAAETPSPNGSKRRNSLGSGGAGNSPPMASVNNPKQVRLVNWITELFMHHIQDIVARQDPAKQGKCVPEDLVYHPPIGRTSLDEVAEVIRLPKFDPEAAIRAANRRADLTSQIRPVIVQQLRELIHILATLYHDNPFHSFEHACHVTMAAEKFMNRIVTPDMDDHHNSNKSNQGLASQVHDYTHGINNDPLTLLAILFSALIHDCDHRGVSNMQLAKEDKEMSDLYKGKSIAEQNSLDIAWDLLMSPQYSDLRQTLFVSRKEMMRFRQVTVNVVLATDIFDKELNDLRKTRWNKAFANDDSDNDEYKTNLRATIVIEHIIQASDVSHTMQHWHIYRKWNERLFMEMLVAYKQGRMGKSPVDFWYDGEIGFFDNYIVPLAKKLKECNVFGVSSDECLNYAMRNRLEWEERGKEVISEMIAKVETN